MVKEYKTTVGEYRTAGRYVGGDGYEEARVDDPCEPAGDGWTLAGTAAADGMLFWSWVRDVPEVR